MPSGMRPSAIGASTRVAKASESTSRRPSPSAVRLWHMRSLLATEPVDFLIGNTYGKYLERDTGTPLIRMVFPIFDRHHYHRFPTWGYEGALRTLVMFLDEYFETLDANTIIPGKTDYSYDIIR